MPLRRQCLERLCNLRSVQNNKRYIISILFRIWHNIAVKWFLFCCACNWMLFWGIYELCKQMLFTNQSNYKSTTYNVLIESFMVNIFFGCVLLHCHTVHICKLNNPQCLINWRYIRLKIQLTTHLRGQLYGYYCVHLDIIINNVW